MTKSLQVRLLGDSETIKTLSRVIVPVVKVLGLGVTFDSNGGSQDDVRYINFSDSPSGDSGLASLELAIDGAISDEGQRGWEFESYENTDPSIGYYTFRFGGPGPVYGLIEPDGNSGLYHASVCMEESGDPITLVEPFCNLENAKAVVEMTIRDILDLWRGEFTSINPTQPASKMITYHYCGHCQRGFLPQDTMDDDPYYEGVWCRACGGPMQEISEVFSQDRAQELSAIFGW